MLKLLNYNFLLFFNIIAIVLIFSINSGFGIYLDGLPWNNKSESIILLCILPITFIFNFKFIIKKKIFFIFASILIFKLIGGYIYSQKGIYFDVYSQINSEKLITNLENYLVIKNKNTNYNKNQIENIKSKFISKTELKKITLNKTFNSFWNNNHTARITKPLLGKNNFPLDWARGYKTNKWDKLEVVFNINGYLKLKENEILVIETLGLNNLEKLNNVNNKIFFTNDSLNVLNEEFRNLKYSSNYEIINLEEFNLKYSKDNWTFVPYIYNYKNNTLESAFDLNRLIASDNDLFTSNFFDDLYVFFTLIIEIIFILLIIIWLIDTINKFLSNIFSNKILIFKWMYFSIFLVLPFLIYFLFYSYDFFIFRIIDSINTFQLSLSIILQFIFIFYLSYKKILNINNPIQVLIVLVLLPSIFYFGVIFSENIYNINNFPFSDKEKDDWTILHIISRLISLGDFSTSRFCLQNFYEFSNDNWLSYIKIKEIRNIICDSESLANIYFHNPLYRYVLSGLFTIFGHGSFVIKIIDLWCIVFIALFIAKLFNKINISYYYVYFSAFIYLFINFAGPYRYLIGRGKEEFLSTFFIFLAITIMFFYKKNKINFYCGILFSILAFQLRLDYIFLILAIVFFYFEPITGNTTSIFKKIFKEYFKNIFIFTFLICLSIIILCIRSYLLTGYIYPVHPYQFVMVMNTDHSLYDKFYDWINHLNYVLSSGYGFPYEARFPSLILLFGTIFLVTVFFIRNFQIKFKIPYAITVCVISIIFSFIFFQKPTYPPRSSIHLLPFSTIGFIYIIYILNYYIVKKRKIDLNSN